MQARQEGPHHGRGFARRGEAEHHQVDEAGDRGDDRELDSRDAHARQGRGGLRVDAHESQDAEADETSDDGGGQEGHVGAQQACAVHEAVLARDPHDGDDALGKAARGLAESGGDDPPLSAGHGVHRPSDDHLDDGGADAHEEHGLDVLVGEEDALAHEDHAGGCDARHEGCQDEGVGGDGRGVSALGGHCDFHHGHRAGHEHRGGDQGQRRDCANAQVVAVGDGLVVTVGDGPSHARKDRGRQGHRDERLGDHEDHERRRVGEDADDAALRAVAADVAVSHGGQVVGR